jgi:hypothetical protein
MLRSVLNSLLYFPSRATEATPREAGLAFEDLEILTGDHGQLHGWWIRSQSRAIGHVLLCHGNAGNAGDRVRRVPTATLVPPGPPCWTDPASTVGPRRLVSNEAPG